MIHKKNIALDFDGTLVTCMNRQMLLLRSLFCHQFSDLDMRVVWDLKREGYSTQSALIQLGMAAQSARQVSEKWKVRIEEPFWLSLDRCFDDVSVVLSALNMSGYRLSLLTARKHPHWLRIQLRNLGLLKWLENVAVVDPGQATKEKETWLRAIKPALFIGDTESDADAAAGSKTAFVALDRGQRSRRFLAEQGISLCVGSLSEALAKADITLASLRNIDGAR